MNSLSWVIYFGILFLLCIFLFLNYVINKIDLELSQKVYVPVSSSFFDGLVERNVWRCILTVHFISRTRFPSIAKWYIMFCRVVRLCKKEFKSSSNSVTFVWPRWIPYLTGAHPTGNYGSNLHAFFAWLKKKNLQKKDCIRVF